MKRVHEIGPLLRRLHGGQVRKLCLRVGTTCPNRDGVKGLGGCIFCAEEVTDQAPGLEHQIQRKLARAPAETSFIAYLQDHSATYIPAQRLDQHLTTIRQAGRFVGVTIGTRSDCLDEAILAVLKRHAASGPPLLVELGLQSACEATLGLVNRCHDVESFRCAVNSLHQRGVRVCAHVILGLPTPGPKAGEIAVEGVEHALATAALIDALKVDAVKVHHCHVLRGTRLAQLHATGRYAPPSLERYIELLIAFLERIPAAVEVHRLMGEAPRQIVVAPAYTAQKISTLHTIRTALEDRDIWQGSEVPMKSSRAAAAEGSDAKQIEGFEPKVQTP